MIQWIPDPDEEYNQQHATIRDIAVIIYSDRDGERWDCQIGLETEFYSLDATEEYAARREAERDAIEIAKDESHE